MIKVSEQKQTRGVFGLVLFSVVGLLLAGLIVIHFVTGIPFEKFTADPASTAVQNPIYGYISNIGILLWCACVSICFFSALILNMNKRGVQAAHFLLCFGALTAVLMFDDLFMFHESLAPNYLSLSEKWVILFYGIFAVASFYHFRRFILAHDMRYLILAIVTLGSSVLVDQISTRFYFPGEYFVEDGLKLIGIAGWFAYFVTLAFGKVMAVVAANKNQVYLIRNRRGSRHKSFAHN